MASWTSLALLSALAVSALSFPDESAYKIPNVGTNRRSQYFVQHDDGTYKYGYDTGENAFESARLHHAGRLDGRFGYRDPDGNAVNVEYESGTGGFRASGNRIPSAHPDFYAAHAAARARPNFVDPLANTGTDASYNFNFAEDGLARTETSDADGTVRGSYSYTDEEGRTRTYHYTAGKETGFVIEGDDLPEAPLVPGGTPAATSLRAGSSSAFRGSTSRISSFRPSTTHSSTSHSTSGHSSTTGAASTAFRKPSTTFHGSSFGSSTAFGRPSVSSTGHTSSVGSSTAYRRPSVSTTSHTSSVGSSTAFRRPSVSTTGHTSSFGSTAAFRRPAVSTSSHTVGSTTSFRAPSAPSRSHFASTRQSSGPVEIANTRSQVNDDGSYAFAYETSSHSRAESGDANVNVDGNFEFVAEDDGQRRAIKYEAGSDTGFIAEGAHIPVGPEVPGAPSGQPTGRIVPVTSVNYIDPLADTNTDASYSFGFESEQYSRSESADADGNVRGTYTVVDDDGTRRTYQFRAGEGIGYETTEVSSSRGPAPSRAAAAAGATSSFSSTAAATGVTTGAASRPSTATGSSVISYKSPTASRGTHFSSGTQSHHGAAHSGAAHSASRGSGSTFSSGTQSLHGVAHSGASHSASRGSSSTFSSGSSGFSHGTRTPVGASFKTTATKTQEVFPGFKLRQYGTEDNSGKYGYVLTYDN